MKFDLSKIEMSKQDIKKGVRLPSRLTRDLAEFVGIMVGDGHLSSFVRLDKKGRKIIQSDLKISGNKKERCYLMYIMNLFYSLFNIKLIYAQDTEPNAIILRVYSKGIVQFLSKICEIPLNRKTCTVRIPNLIKNSDSSIKYCFLRGLADTDFSLVFQNKTGKGHNYPVIKAKFRSKNLVKDLEDVFSHLRFNYCTYYNEMRKDERFEPTRIHNIYLYGRENLRKWMSLIGFSNPKYWRKIKKWEQDGVCPPGY